VLLALIVAVFILARVFGLIRFLCPISDFDSHLGMIVHEFQCCENGGVHFNAVNAL
jgi:hypothetical protein